MLKFHCDVIHFLIWRRPCLNSPLQWPHGAISHLLRDHLEAPDSSPVFVYFKRKLVETRVVGGIGT